MYCDLLCYFIEVTFCIFGGLLTTNMDCLLFNKYNLNQIKKKKLNHKLLNLT